MVAQFSYICSYCHIKVAVDESPGNAIVCCEACFPLMKQAAIESKGECDNSKPVKEGARHITFDDGTILRAYPVKTDMLPQGLRGKKVRALPEAQTSCPCGHPALWLVGDQPVCGKHLWTILRPIKK